jgi:hypothetical protein
MMIRKLHKTLALIFTEIIILTAVLFSAAVAQINDTTKIEYQCLRFDGIDDVVNAKDIDAFDGSQLCTIEMWVRIDTFNAWNTFFCKFKNISNRIQFQQYNEPGKIAVVVNNGADIKKDGNQAYFFTPTAEMTIGDWFHLAMVFDGTLDDNDKLKVYINGMRRPLQREPAAHGALPSHLPSTDAPLLLGAEKTSGAFGFKGLMDEVRIWTIARTQAQICATMNKSLTGQEDGLLVNYPVFSNQSGNAIEIAKLIDHSPGKHHADLCNFNVKNSFIERENGTPSVQSSELKASDLNKNEVKLTWKRGSGSSNIVFACENDSLHQPLELSSAETYDADTTFGKGSHAGNWYCVYNGNEPSVCITGLKPAISYNMMVCDYNGGPGHEQYLVSSNSGNTISITTEKQEKIPQTLVFDSLPDVFLGDTNISLIASASSGLKVKFSSGDTNVAKFVDGTLKLMSAGTISISASQPGDENYLPATDVTRTFMVMKNITKEETKSQTIVRLPDHSKKGWFLTRTVGGGAVLTAVIISLVLSSHSDGKSDNGKIVTAEKPPSDPF